MSPGDPAYGVETSGLSDAVISSICIGSGPLGPVCISTGLSIGILVISMSSGSSYNKLIILCACSIMRNPLSCASGVTGNPLFCTEATRETFIASVALIYSLALRAS
jgi:hypothetical protein